MGRGSGLLLGPDLLFVIQLRLLSIADRAEDVCARSTNNDSTTMPISTSNSCSPSIRNRLGSMLNFSPRHFAASSDDTNPKLVRKRRAKAMAKKGVSVWASVSWGNEKRQYQCVHYC